MREECTHMDPPVGSRRALRKQCYRLRNTPPISPSVNFQPQAFVCTVQNTVTNAVRFRPRYRVYLGTGWIPVCCNKWSEFYNISTALKRHILAIVKAAALESPPGLEEDPVHISMQHPHKTDATWIQDVWIFFSTLPGDGSHYGRVRYAATKFLDHDEGCLRLYGHWLRSIDAVHRTLFEAQWLDMQFRHKHAHEQVDKAGLLTFPLSLSKFRLEYQALDIRRHRLRTDTCDACDTYNQAVKALVRFSMKKAMLDTKHRAHHAKSAQATAGRTHDMATCHTNPLKLTRDSVRKQPANSVEGMVCMQMDMGSNLETPLLRSGIAHYHTLSHTKAYIIAAYGIYFYYMWHQTEAKAGGNNMCSISEHFYNNFASGATEERCWCDNCTGQLKCHCRVMYDAWQVAIGRLRRLCRCFLCCGHTYMGCGPDSAHSRVRAKSNAKTSIASSSAWMEVVREASVRHKVIHTACIVDLWKTWHNKGETGFLDSMYVVPSKTMCGKPFRITSYCRQNHGWDYLYNPETKQRDIKEQHPDEVWFYASHAIDAVPDKVIYRREGTPLLFDIPAEFNVRRNFFPLGKNAASCNKIVSNINTALGKINVKGAEHTWWGGILNAPYEDVDDDDDDYSDANDDDDDDDDG
jgi:hypothetical protein